MTLVLAESVIPAKAGIQRNTGFRVKPGMTTLAGLMSSCDSYSRMDPLFQYFILPLFLISFLEV
jgi:hypothetical protein